MWFWRWSGMNQCHCKCNVTQSQSGRKLLKEVSKIWGLATVDVKVLASGIRKIIASLKFDRM